MECDILGAVVPYAARIMSHTSVVRSGQWSKDWRRYDELFNEEHMMIKSGRHVCERCHQEYEWRARRLENGERIRGLFEGFGNINIATAEIVNGTYVIVGRCPNCGHHSLKNLYECEQ